jgi:hypothetical protein
MLAVMVTASTMNALFPLMAASSVTDAPVIVAFVGAFHRAPTI